MSTLSPLESAIRRKAEAAVQGAGRAELAALREALVTCLVRLSDTGAFVRRSAARQALPSAALPLIGKLIAVRLLVDMPGDRIEVAHEALFRAWPVLVDWLSEERDFLVDLARVERHHEEYRRTTGTTRAKTLLGGILLDRARSWLERHPGRFSSETAAFILASARHADAEWAVRAEERGAPAASCEEPRAAGPTRAHPARAAAGLPARRRGRLPRPLAAAIAAAIGLAAIIGWSVIRHGMSVEAHTGSEPLAFTPSPEATSPKTPPLLGQQAGGRPSLRAPKTDAARPELGAAPTFAKDEVVIASDRDGQTLRAASQQAQPDDRTGADDLAALDRMGGLRLAQDDQPGALGAYQDALSALREQARETGATFPKRRIVETLQVVGDAKLASGDRPGAVDAYEEAIDTAGDLVADGDQAARPLLTASLIRLGDGRLQAGDRPGALAAYRQGLAVARTGAKETTDAAARYALGSVLERIGAAELKGTDLAGALTTLREAQAVLGDLARNEGDLAARGALAKVLADIGGGELAAGDRDAAARAFEEGLTLRRADAKSARTATAWRALAEDLEHAGTAKLGMGDLTGAQAAFAEAAAILGGLPAGHGDGRARLAAALARLGEAELAKAEAAATDSAYNRLRMGLAAGGQPNGEARSAVSQAVDDLAAQRLAPGGYAAEALSAYEGLIPLLRSAEPMSATTQQALADGLDTVGELASRLGDRQRSRLASSEAVALGRKLGGDGASRRWLALALRSTGDGEMRADNTTGANNAYAESLAILRAIANGDPSPSAELDVASGLEKVADGSLRAGRTTDALAAYGEELAILRSLPKGASDPALERQGSAVLLKLATAKQLSGDRAGEAADFSAATSALGDAAKGDAQAQAPVIAALGQFALAASDPLPAYRQMLALLPASSAEPGSTPAESTDLRASVDETGRLAR